MFFGSWVDFGSLERVFVLFFPDWAPAQGSLLVWCGPWGPWTGPGLGGWRRIKFTRFYSRILSKSGFGSDLVSILGSQEIAILVEDSQ